MLTGSLVTLTALQPLSGSHDTLLGTRVHPVPNYSRLHSCRNCTSSQALRSGSEDTQWDPHLFRSSVKHWVFTHPPASHTPRSLPDILCSVTSSSLGKAALLSSSELAGQPGTRALLQPLAGLEPSVLTPEQHLHQASGPAPPKLGEPGPEKGTAPSLLPFLPTMPRIPESPPTLSPTPHSLQPRE